MKRNRLAAAIVATLPFGIPSAALAQDPATAGGETAGIESIVVQGSFLNSGAQSAMKLDAPILDTPFSVSSYSDTFMKAIETSNIADMYNYMTGIKRAGQTGYDVVVRGMKAGGNDRNSILVDGLPGLTGRFGSPPTIGIEHMELVKGPMSVLYGQAQPGGFINLITKKPKSTASAEVGVKLTGVQGHGVSVADANGYEVTLDATGPVDAGKKFLYRFVAQTANRDLFRFDTYERPMYLAPSLTWNIDDTTLATAQIEYRKTTTAYDTGLVARNYDIGTVASLRTRYQEPGDWQSEKGKTLSLYLEHTFAGDIKWSASTRSVRSEDGQEDFDVSTRSDTAPLGFIIRRPRKQLNHRRYDFGDTNVAIPFQTGSVSHKLLIGINGGREYTDLDRQQYYDVGTCGGAVPASLLCMSMYAPVYGQVNLGNFPQFSGTAFTLDRQHRLTSSRSLGAYASDLLTLSEHWKATLGVRNAHEEQNLKEVRVLQAATNANPPPQNKVSNKVLPLAGLLYQPTKDWTVYSSYSTSYVPAPASSQDATGTNPFRPESSKQLELGAKAENLLQGKLSGTLAFFRIRKDNALSTFSGGLCPSTIGTCTQQVGQEKSDGIELELNARPVENWQLSAGYAYTDARIGTSAIPIQIGARLTNVARNSANFWSRYDIASGALAGISLGIGMSYTGERDGPLPTVANPSVLKLPSYAVADLAISYTRGRYDFNFKVGNVFDKTYYESTGFTGQTGITPGVPRNLAFSMRARF